MCLHCEREGESGGRGISALSCKVHNIICHVNVDVCLYLCVCV